MYDETSDRTYQAARADLNDGIDRALDNLRTGVATTFRKVHAIQFAAPWHKKSRDVGCA